jgi:invasion protein IalB
VTLRSLILAAAFALTASLSSGSPSLAQNATGASGQPYLKETHGTWQVQCLLIETGGERCQLYQQLNASPGNPVGEINVFPLPSGQGAPAGAVIIVPLETLLTSELDFEISGIENKRYPFAWCSNVGCVARIAITSEELGAMKLSTLATITITSIRAPKTPLKLTVSLQGFTAGFNAMQAANSPG